MKNNANVRHCSHVNGLHVRGVGRKEEGRSELGNSDTSPERAMVAPSWVCVLVFSMARAPGAKT